MATLGDMLEAVKAGDVARVQALVESDATLLNARDEAGVSAVLLATYYGYPDMAQILIDRGATLNVFEAAATGQHERLAALIKADPSLVNMHSTDGHTPLGLAAYFGHPAVVDLLLAGGAQPNTASRNEMRVMPLHSAVAHWRPEIALAITKSLIAHGAEVNAKQQGGWTPLHETADNGYLEIARLLLDHGADANATNDAGTTPLKMAQDKGYHELAALLRERGERATRSA